MRYARREVTLIILAGVLGTALITWAAGLWGLVPAVLALAVLSFFRDPRRRPPTGDGLILAAADGKIVEISRDLPGPDGTARLRIMIFLSVFNVHINRSPCAARVREVRYEPGAFLNALRPEADTQNESNTLVLDPSEPLPGPIHVRQISGVLARRIVCATRVGESLAAGQRYGMIKLGSRTEVTLPEHPDWEICVSVGAKVQAGLTVLARLRAGSTVPAGAARADAAATGTTPASAAPDAGPDRSVQPGHSDDTES